MYVGTLALLLPLLVSTQVQAFQGFHGRRGTGPRAQFPMHSHVIARDMPPRNTTLTNRANLGSTITVDNTMSRRNATFVPRAEGLFMGGYFTDWTADKTPPEKVDFTRFDVIDYAFAIPDAAGNLVLSGGATSEDILTRLVTAAHAAGKHVKLSVGGWTGSTHFSTIVASEATRTTFMNNIVDIIAKFELDGIDLDWEYPGVPGADGNVVSPDDSANYLIFLQALRAAVPEGKLITAATQTRPFAGPDGQPLADVSEFAKVFDYLLLMNYDTWGSSATPGPNAALRNGCEGATQPLANAEDSVASWVAAGFPANQLTLGIAGYGYTQASTAESLVHRRDVPKKRAVLSKPAKHGKHGKRANKKRCKKIVPAADPDPAQVPLSAPTTPDAEVPSDGAVVDPLATTDAVNKIHADVGEVLVLNGDGAPEGGQIGFRGLVDQGVLALEDGVYVGASGFTRHWDECSSTPWLKSSTQIVTYDDPESLQLKGQFAKETGLLGVTMWSIDGDDVDGTWPLTDALRAGMGI